MDIGGEVAAAFEKARVVFEQGADDLGRGGGAFCAYVDGTKVVDLWAGEAREGRPWDRDTTAVLMSATKGMCTLCAQILHDRGLLDLDAPVVRYWPEFAQNGKERVTVRQVLSHTSGVVTITPHEDELAWDGGGWDDQETIATWLAEAAPAWEPGSRVGYHAMTYGWLVAELARRIDGRSVGTFFREEVAEPVGVDVRIGTPGAEQHRVARVIQDPPEERRRQLEAVLQSLPAETRDELMKLMDGISDPASVSGRAFLVGTKGGILDVLPEFMATPKVLAAEIGSSNGTGTAEGVARMYAVLACGGELDGVRLVSPASIDAFAERQAEGTDAVMGTAAAWAVGYMANIPPRPGMPLRFGPSERAFGHPGAGGQLGIADPTRRVSLGFVRSHLSTVPLFGPQLVQALYDCLP